MRRGYYNSKIFGGTNFLVVLWTLISFFRFALIFGKDTLGIVFDPTFTLYIMPLVFLLILNLIMSIGIFFPTLKNRIWAFSIILASITLLVLNSFQTKIEQIQEVQAKEVTIQEF